MCHTEAYMDDPISSQEVSRRLSSIVSLSDGDAEQLFQLLKGVKAASDRMAEIVPIFPGEVDAKSLSQTVD